MSVVNFIVTYRGESHSLNLPADSPLLSLHEQLKELTGVPTSLQKLLYKGKKPNASPKDATLEQAGFKDGLKVQLVGPKAEELGGMQSAESEKRKKDEILARRNAMNLPKPRSTGIPSSSNLSYRFHNLLPLSHLPRPDAALSILQRLSSDPAIQHIMQVHQFSVGTLTELAPHEHPNLLGLNVNRGEAIKLRLRTDGYDGFRLYTDIRRVLCHELAHNVWGDHDDNFKTLNSRLNKDVADFEQAQRAGAHLLGPEDAYTPSPSSSPSLFDPEVESEAQSYILGGSSPSGPIGGSREERRRRALEAAISRLRKEEEELEHSCGTAGPSHERDASPSASSAS